jgi:SAM-dependent methyltransferase
MVLRTDIDDRQLGHRQIWEQKESIRLLYRDFHRRLLQACPSGRIIDIGGGTAHVKELVPDAVSVDVLPFPGIDAVADAHNLPFADGTFAGAVMLDVLHHLERPIDFLKEASRVLKPGGTLAMLEPAMTTIARPFYRYLHDEPVDMSVDPFAEVVINPARDPFDSNQAIPTLLFTTASARERLEKTIPGLRVKTVEWLSLFAYPLSGGFQKWSLMPAKLVRPVLTLEDSAPRFIRRSIAFRMLIVLQRV